MSDEDYSAEAEHEEDEVPVKESVEAVEPTDAPIVDVVPPNPNANPDDASQEDASAQE